MPPKKGKGKGRKGDDDDIWSGFLKQPQLATPADLDPPFSLHNREKGGETAKPVDLLAAPVDDDDTPEPSKSRTRGFASGFAGLSLADAGDAGGGEEEEDFGGLMVRPSPPTSLVALRR